MMDVQAGIVTAGLSSHGTQEPHGTSVSVARMHFLRFLGTVQSGLGLVHHFIAHFCFVLASPELHAGQAEHWHRLLPVLCLPSRLGHAMIQQLVWEKQRHC